MQLKEDISDSLRKPAEAALRWINNTQNKQFELTGLVDYEQALEAQSGQAVEFGLVLCDGEICTREQVRIEQIDAGYQVSRLEKGQLDVPALLDPPKGLREAWLDEQLEKYDFLLLLFYRGRW